MKFKEAYEYAKEHSATFRNHDKNVKESVEKGEASACMIFSVDAEETFYYGFDGVDMHKGKHTAKRAKVLFDREEVLIIIA